MCMLNSNNVVFNWSNDRNIGNRDKLSLFSRQNLTEVKFYATSYNINQHSPTWYLRGGQTDATLIPNNVGICCDRMLRPLDQGLRVCIKG